jgi:hypothetical protein
MLQCINVALHNISARCVKSGTTAWFREWMATDQRGNTLVTNRQSDRVPSGALRRNLKPVSRKGARAIYLRSL